MQPLRLLDRQLLFVRVDDEDQVRDAADILHAAERLFELVALARDHEALFFGQSDGAAAKLFIQFAQALDRRGNGLPVGQHAAEPARIDIILRRPFGGIRNRVLGLPFGADEKHAAAARDRIGNGLEGLMQ